MSTVTSLDEPILGFASSKETEQKEKNQPKCKTFELTVHQNGIPMFKGTNDNEMSKRKNCKAIEDETVQNNQTKKVKSVKKLEDQVTFDWIGCALTILLQKGSTKLKKLKKKVVNGYLTLHPETIKTKVELESKFDKKICRSKKFTISNDIVSVSILANHSIQESVDLSVKTQNIEVQKTQTSINLSNLPTQLVKSCQDTKKG